MQKLVTIYLDNLAYAKGKMMVSNLGDKHALVEEHLQQDLSEGWTISSVSGFGGGSDGLAVRGWMVVVLEKKEA